eukprot:SM000013S26471  [mRNA]  locus=s13:550183:552906:- [translate_table: standard]
MLRRARPAALLPLLLLLPCIAAGLLGAALAAAGKGPPKDGKPVCILGAGPSGLAAATSLEEKGYNVVVFEKEESVGGRTRSFEYHKEGLFYDEGAIIISTDYVNVLELIDRFNFTVDIGQQGAFAQYFFDPSSGFSASTSTFSNPFTATQQQNALRQYVTLWSEWRYSGQHNDTEYSIPFGTWLQNHGLQALLPFFLTTMFCYGYGSMTSTPALYGLSVVVAFPQLTSRLGFLGLDKEELGLLSQVEHSGYATSLIDLGDSGRAQLTVPSAYYGLLSGTSIAEPTGDGSPIAFSVETGKSLATVYSWNRNTTAISKGNVQAAAVATLGLLGPTTSLGQLTTASFKVNRKTLP